MPRLAHALAVAALIVSFAAAPLRAELSVDITEGRVTPLAIAVTDFFGASLEAAKTGHSHNLYHRLEVSLVNSYSLGLDF